MAAACVYARPADWYTNSTPVGTRPKTGQETPEREWAGKETKDVVPNLLNETRENQASGGTVSAKAPEDNIKPNINPTVGQLEECELEKGNSGQNNFAINQADAHTTTTGRHLPGSSARKPDVAQNGLRSPSGAGIADNSEHNEVTYSSENRKPSASKLPAEFSSGISHPQDSESDQKPHQGAAISDSRDLGPTKSPEQSTSQEPEATAGLSDVPEDPSNPMPVGDDQTDPRNTSDSSAAFNTPLTAPSPPVPVPINQLSRSNSKERVTQLKKRFEQSSSVASPTLSTNPPVTNGHSDTHQEALQQQNSQSASSASILDQPSSKPVVSRPATAPAHQPPIRMPAYTGWDGVNLDDPEPLGPAGFFPSSATMGPQPEI